MSFYFRRLPLIPVLLGMMLPSAFPRTAAADTLHAVFDEGLDPASAWDARGWRAADPAGLDGGAADPAAVRARWNNRWLVFEFVCRDADIVSPGEIDGLDHFRLGDTVEIFVGRAGEKAYAEVHATPAGRKSLYFFRDYRERGTAPDDAGQVVVRSGRVRGGWRAILCLPWSALGGEPRRGVWEVLAGRYDHGIDGRGPVLSSFPVQKGRPDFHARDRYARLILQP